MIKHIVMYTLKEGVEKTEAVAMIRSVLLPLVGQIPGLTKMEVCQAYQGMDYVLYSEFSSREALQDYQKHPLHLQAKAHFGHLLDQRISADYEV